MTLTLLEGAIDALNTYLTANIMAKVADLNSRYSDDMPDIKIWYLGNTPTAEPEYPTVVIQGIGMLPKAQRALSLQMQNEVNLIVFVGDDDVEVRFRRLCRYALGLIELCNAGEGSMGYHVYFTGAITVTDTMDTQPFLQGIIIPVILEQIEDF